MYDGATASSTEEMIKRATMAEVEVKKSETEPLYLGERDSPGPYPLEHTSRLIGYRLPPRGS